MQNRQTHPPAALPISLPVRPRGFALALLIFIFLALPLAAQTPVQPLARIRQTETLRCGINAETPEYSTSDDHGPRPAFDAELCRAVAVAILGPAARTTLTSYPDDVAAMDALRSGAVDLLPTLTDDLTHSPGLTFTRPVVYDGVGFLVPIASKIASAAELSGKKICFLSETEPELALRAWFQSQPPAQHLKFAPFPFQEEGEMEAAFVTGNCAALAGDLTRLANTRLNFGPLAARYTLLPDQISKDPLAAASLAGDPAFAAIVRWTLEVLIQAEESGVTQHTVAATRTSSDPTLRILTGQTREIGARLALDDAWATNVLAATGNYGEIFDRTLGQPLQLPRALNRLYTQGGLLYAIPIK